MLEGICRYQVILQGPLPGADPEGGLSLPNHPPPPPSMMEDKVLVLVGRSREGALVAPPRILNHPLLLKFISVVIIWTSLNEQF